jgi:hypothetical protein
MRKPQVRIQLLAADWVQQLKVTALQAVLLEADKVGLVLQLLVGLVVAVQVAVHLQQQRVVWVEMEVILLAVAGEVAEVLQLVVLVAKVQQVKLEFGAGNDIKQYYTIT